jgi:protein TonB
VATVAVIATRPAYDAEGKKKVDVSFRPPPPPPEPAKIEKPPPPLPKRVQAPPPVVVAEVIAPSPIAAPAAAAMVAPKEVPKQAAPESDTAVAERHMAVGGTGDGAGTGVGGDGPDDSPAPVAAIAGNLGPVNLPEDADPPEPSDDNAQPEYPESARATGQEARVVLKVVIEKNGAVGKIQVLKGEEPFLSSALQVVRTWHYEPAHLDGQPISVFKIVNLTFHLRE